MKKYEIKHIGIAVENQSRWRTSIMRSWGSISSSPHRTKKKEWHSSWIAAIKSMLELGKIPNVLPLADRINHHLQLHIALTSVDPDKDAEYLVSKGATFIEKCPIRRPGENLIVFSDPWGATPPSW